MIKIISMLALSLVATSAFAADISLSQAPQSPIVIAADMSVGGKNPFVVRGPWFKAQFQVSSDQLITVVGIQEVVTANNGTTMTYYLNFPTPIEISGRSTYQTVDQYMGGLPSQDGFVYKVDLRLVGWTGGAASPGPMLTAISSFVTQ